MVADRTNTADTRGDRQHFIVQTAFAEFLETPYLRDMKIGFIHIALVIQIYGDFAVTFYPADRFDNNFISHIFSLL